MATSVRPALRLRWEQPGGGRRLPPAETRKIPSPLSKHTRVLRQAATPGRKCWVRRVPVCAVRRGHQAGRRGAPSRLPKRMGVGAF